MLKKIILTSLISLLAVGASASDGMFSVFGLAKIAYKAKNESSDSIDTSYRAAPTGQLVENAFSPDGGAEALVVKIINSAQTSIRLAGYSFTSPTIVKALIAAKKRGVDVRLVVDFKNNLQEGRSKAGQAALDNVVAANIPARTISVYPIFHDKSICVDGKHVMTGSFNFSKAAAKSNSENVLVLWNYPAVTRSYLAHWEDRWSKGTDYKISY